MGSVKKLSELLPSQDWIDRRKNYLGGSSVATVLGKNPFQTPLQLWQEKRGQVRIQDEIPISVAMFGNLFEPILALHFSEKTHLTVRNESKTREHKEYSFLRANIDRIIVSNNKHGGTGILELKTTNSHSVRAWEDEYPETWKYQIQFYLALSGYSYAYLQVYERDTCIYHEPVYIERDDRLISDMIPKLVEWWQKHMVEGVMPEPINDEDLMIIYPQAREGQVRQASTLAYEYWQSLTKVKTQIKKFKVLEDQFCHLLKSEMQDADSLAYGEQELATWKNQSTKRLNQSLLKQNYPEEFKECLETSTSRRFIVK